jgi:hypothetical protein
MRIYAALVGLKDLRDAPVGFAEEAPVQTLTGPQAEREEHREVRRIRRLERQAGR